MGSAILHIAADLQNYSYSLKPPFMFTAGSEGLKLSLKEFCHQATCNKTFSNLSDVVSFSIVQMTPSTL